MSNEIQKMFCPSCGGPVSFQPGREDTFCSHCGAQLYFQDDKLEVKLKHEEFVMEQKQKEAESKREWIALAIMWGFIGLMFIAIFIAALVKMH